MDPLVSIIIPIYGVERFVEDCLRSVFNQTYSNIEVILVNDCTPDNSMQIARDIILELNKDVDFVVRYVDHNRNRGVSAARNTGVLNATGDYIYFLDSDDELMPDSISTLVKPLKNNKRYDYIIADYCQIGPKKKYYGIKTKEGEINSNERILYEYCSQNLFPYPVNKLCRLDFIKKNNLLFDESIKNHEDELWSFLLSVYAQTIYVLSKETYIYKTREGSLTTAETKKEKIQGYVCIENEMRKIIIEMFVNKNYAYRLFDNILKEKYMICFINNWGKEYKELRKNDIRTFGYIIKRSLNSMHYFRSHAHRLLFRTWGFYIYSFILRKVI